MEISSCGFPEGGWKDTLGNAAQQNVYSNTPGQTFRHRRTTALGICCVEHKLEKMTSLFCPGELARRTYLVVQLLMHLTCRTFGAEGGVPVMMCS